MRVCTVQFCCGMPVQVAFLDRLDTDTLSQEYTNLQSLVSASCFVIGLESDMDNAQCNSAVTIRIIAELSTHTCANHTMNSVWPQAKGGCCLPDFAVLCETCLCFWLYLLCLSTTHQ